MIKKLIQHISFVAPWLAGLVLIFVPLSGWYVFTLLEAWLPHLFVLSLLWVVWLILRWRLRAAFWLLICLLPAYTRLEDIFEPKPASHAHKPASDELIVAQYNLLQSNQIKARFLKVLQNSPADVLAFQEVNPSWQKLLDESLKDSHPYRVVVPQENNYGMALYSRRPLEDVEVMNWEGYPAIAGLLSGPGQDTLIMSLHAASPTTPQRHRKRNIQLAKATAYLQEKRLPSLVLGDFNTVPWDQHLQKMKMQADLSDSRESYAATWPAKLGRFGIPIDYVLYSSEWQQLETRVLPIPGSDHRGLEVRLAFHDPQAPAKLLLP